MTMASVASCERPGRGRESSSQLPTFIMSMQEHEDEDEPAAERLIRSLDVILFYASVIERVVDEARDLTATERRTLKRGAAHIFSTADDLMTQLTNQQASAN